MCSWQIPFIYTSNYSWPVSVCASFRGWSSLDWAMLRDTEVAYHSLVITEHWITANHVPTWPSITPFHSVVHLFNTASPKAPRSLGFTNNIEMKFLSLFFSEQMGVSECAQHNVISTSAQRSGSVRTMRDFSANVSRAFQRLRPHFQCILLHKKNPPFLLQWKLHTTTYSLIRKKGDGVRNEETSNAYKAFVRKAKQHKQKAEFWREFEVDFYKSMILF